MAIANLPPEEVSNKLQDVVVQLLALSNLLNEISESSGNSNRTTDTLCGLSLITDDLATKVDNLATALVSKVTACQESEVHHA